MIEDHSSAPQDADAVTVAAREWQSGSPHYVAECRALCVVGARVKRRRQVMPTTFVYAIHFARETTPDYAHISPPIDCRACFTRSILSPPTPRSFCSFRHFAGFTPAAISLKNRIITSRQMPPPLLFDLLLPYACAQPRDLFYAAFIRC